MQQVWHLTPDAGRDPNRVTPGIPVGLRIGTWPVEPGQQVHGEFRAVSWGAWPPRGKFLPAG
jgi:hypothetical protein